jgi:nitroreductase
LKVAAVAYQDLLWPGCIFGTWPEVVYFRYMDFKNLKEIVEHRRSFKPALMNGKKIDDAAILQWIALADWAPTHGHTEPWRFIVFANQAVQRFCHDHAELYRLHTASARFETAKFEKLWHNGDHCSHIIVVYMKRGSNPKITADEEICAVAASIEHILLGAAAMHLAALWSTGGLTHHAAMKTFFGLETQDQLVGMLYLGYADHPNKTGHRMVPLGEKIDWRG